MNQLKTGEVSEAAQVASDLQNELAEVLRQRAALSAVLRTIASSPHDLQPVFDTIVESARGLSGADMGVFRLVEEAGFRLVARAVSPGVSDEALPPKLVERGAFHGSFYDRLIASKSPLHVPDVTALDLDRSGAALASIIQRGLRTLLYVPMLRKEELVGSLALGRRRVQHFTEKEIELLTDFAAEATIALEIVHRERQLREVQMELARANRVATLGQLTASITHEVKQPISAARTGVSAALRWLDKTPPDLAEVRDALDSTVRATDRAGDVITRIQALMTKAPPKKEVFDLNEATMEVIGLTHGEATKTGVRVRPQFAPCLPRTHADRVQLQQVTLNLIVNGIQAMSDVADGPRDLLISTEAIEYGVRVGVLDTGPGLRPESLPRLFEPFYTTKPNGIGMGLSICRSIIEAHGGRLWATAREPHGALFQFTIPAEPETTS
jgi:C4-dicarboxylate-specific signal transduction histidine kinase